MLDAFLGARENALSLSLMVAKGPSEIRNAGRVAGAFLTGLKMHGLVCSPDEFLSLFRVDYWQGSLCIFQARIIARSGFLIPAILRV